MRVKGAVITLYVKRTPPLPYIFTSKAHPKHKKHFYPARGFLLCGTCGCMITAETHKGHDYYHCTNGKFNCQEHSSYIRSEEIDKIVSILFLKLKIDEELINMSGEAYKQRNTDKTNYTQSSLDTLSQELKSLLKRELMLADGTAPN
jgi:arsenate reductase-like glutaredoxin family protein